MTSLLLRRPRVAWQDRTRDYRVFIDGAQVAQVASGDEIGIPIAPGRHVMQLRIDWCRSEALHVDIAPGEVQAFECGPSARPWLALLYITVFRNRYLRLRRA